MLFFARFVVWIVETLPKSKFQREMGLILNYADCRREVIAWHRAELEKLDPMFRLQQDSLRLVVAREKARARGIGPMDQGYPDIFNFSEIDWDGEAEVHSGVLERYRRTGKERMQRLDEALREYPQGRVDAVTKACTDALKPEGTSRSEPAIPGEGFMGKVE